MDNFTKDKSFQALIMSLLIHGFFMLSVNFDLFKAPEPADVVEFEILDQNPKHQQTFVTETQKLNLKPEIEKLKKQAKYLSQFTKRVKKEQVARQTGQTMNAPGRGAGVAQAPKAQVKKPNRPEEPQDNHSIDPSAQRFNKQKSVSMLPEHNSTIGKNIVIGGSSLSEYIPGVQTGYFTSLNTDQFLYYSFFSRINVQLRSRWVQQLRAYAGSLSVQQLNEVAGRPRITQVEILIDPKGKMKNSILVRTAGYRFLDRAVLDSFRDAAPFINPPQELIEQDGLIHLKYSFHLQWRPRFVAR